MSIKMELHFVCMQSKSSGSGKRLEDPKCRTTGPLMVFNFKFPTVSTPLRLGYMNVLSGCKNELSLIKFYQNFDWQTKVMVPNHLWIVSFGWTWSNYVTNIVCSTHKRQHTFSEFLEISAFKIRNASGPHILQQFQFQPANQSPAILNFI